VVNSKERNAMFLPQITQKLIVLKKIKDDRNQAK